MVTKLAKRGMPVDDLDKAVRWRQRHLEWQRSKGVRAVTVAPDAGPASQRAAVSTAAVDRVLPAGAVADIQWASNTRARASSRAGSAAVHVTAGSDAAAGAVAVEDEVDDYMRSRARREAAEASIAEMKQAEMEAQLVRRQDVERAAFVSARQLRDGLTNCARRLGASVATLTTPDACTAVIEAEHRALLQSWSKALADQVEVAPA